MQQQKIVRIGTRGSVLALYQANLTKKLLDQHFRKEGFSFEIVEIKTTGDKVLDKPLSDIGGKALFTKEIDKALIEGQIDIAVHSMKDCETFLQDEVQLAAVLEREDPHDALISYNSIPLDNLEEGAVFGTCSPRRTSQLLNLRPDLKTTLFRGNVPTRLKKVANKEANITMLAVAGLNRLGLRDQITQVFSPLEITPCASQGAIGIVCLKENRSVIDLLTLINHPLSFEAIHLERKFLESLNGTCHTPVGALVRFNKKGNVSFIACVATLDGKHLWRENLSFSRENAEKEICTLGGEMKKWLAHHQL